MVESNASRIGPINLGVKHAGERSAGNPPAAFDVAGAGNVRVVSYRLNQRASARPYLRGAGNNGMGFSDLQSARSSRVRQGVCERPLQAFISSREPGLLDKLVLI